MAKFGASSIKKYCSLLKALESEVFLYLVAQYKSLGPAANFTAHHFTHAEFKRLKDVKINGESTQLKVVRQSLEQHGLQQQDIIDLCDEFYNKNARLTEVCLYSCLIHG